MVSLKTRKYVDFRFTILVELSCVKRLISSRHRQAEMRF